MKIIKLDAIDSTNSFLRQLYAHNEVDDFTVVTTKNQTAGRGQMGAVWKTQEGKNLTASVFKSVSCLNHEDQFYVSMAVSLAIYTTLEKLLIPDLKIKWPNDILSGDKKICGILIENIFKGHALEASIIGVGLNVNQTDFEGLPQASSLKALTGVHYNLDEVLQELVSQLEDYSKYIEQQQFKMLKAAYEEKLFRIEKPSTFKDKKGRLFMGFIKGVTDRGKLKLLLEDEITAEFDLKEVQLLY
ncbi:BirA family transcriptional regulator, biotin operon repressor / biotin-[acetyl-CoA-carboxylase] ligase [Zhouia amylolytica]|uniref:BirA family transcriptional regulator, biotin operon repressor / biotin-[acetyl-CoA-carboxylase] ligase n=1 Tax=Zhouia amylolytica TaxID=376730 RepID=A0A1I6U4C4_9FLAO|nr:biotin--[acetyl-CoA-carboxylase] ligase [Zhouia amylolytica]SFS96251.1 BirA family transcriptional regulator, biotin operon repressor / biotin-[acetyl-CoA-carboxylase] ligase [Zhouia amylolytica]